MSITVVVRNGNLEKAMRVLKKKVQKEGIVRELKERQYYTKPSEKKREAKKQGINSFCLTVDKNGHDYLKTMCSDMGYEILEDINDLPERLLVLYRRLTM